jgi:hypothetical protein
VPDSPRAATAPPVEELLCSVLYWLSAEGRQLVVMLIATNGRVRPLHRFTAGLGMRNRHQLTRLLAREHLPTLECLAGWIRLLLWVTAWERHSTALASASLIDGEDPAVRFRTIKRVANCTWKELKARGSLWITMELQNRCLAQAEARGSQRQSA